MKTLDLFEVLGLDDKPVSEACRLWGAAERMRLSDWWVRVPQYKQPPPVSGEMAWR